MATTKTILLKSQMARLGALSLGLGLLTVPPASAEGHEWSRPTPEQMVEKHLARMTEELELTGEQIAQVRPIIEGHMAKMRALMEKHRRQGRPPGGSERKEMECLRKEMERRLEAVLTEEQMQKHREKEREHRERVRERMGQYGGGSPR